MEKIKANNGMEGLEKQMQKDSLIPELKGRKRKFKALNNENALSLYKGYFNNKMTIFLLHIQKRKPDPDSLTSLKAVMFFDDLYHHMLKTELQNDYYRVFQWLKLFFRRFPYVKPVQKRKAIEFIKLVYQIFGLELKASI